MKRWRRRAIYFVGFIFWLLIMSFPVIAFLLATQGEIEIGGRQGYQLRLFLLQETDHQGVSIEWTRPALTAENCTQSTVNYFLWEGKGENTVYCQCFDAISGELLSVSSQSCPIP